MKMSRFVDLGPGGVNRQGQGLEGAAAWVDSSSALCWVNYLITQTLSFSSG